MRRREMEYQCPICKLHYIEKKNADLCHKWCSAHNSCNLSVASTSIEATMINKKRKDNAN